VKQIRRIVGNLRARPRDAPPQPRLAAASCNGSRGRPLPLAAAAARSGPKSNRIDRLPP